MNNESHKQEEEMNNNEGENVNEAAIGESEEDSSNGGGALEGSLESSYEEPAANVDPMSPPPVDCQSVGSVNRVG